MTPERRKRAEEISKGAPKKKSGAPSKYTEELAIKICEKISTHTCGYNTLRQIYPEFPDTSVLYEWKIKFPFFATKYFEAKKVQSELMLHEMDEMIPGNIGTYIDDHGNERIDSPCASLVIAKLNNRKWMAARLLPKIYGDAKQMEELATINEIQKKELEELRAKLDAQNKRDY